ncbi:MAG: serine hydrolase domain-containing protein [Cyclobacteriaceae bacterium]
MKKLLLLSALALWTACNSPSQTTDTPASQENSAIDTNSQSQAKEELDSIVEGYLSHEGRFPIHSILIYTKNETNGLEYHNGTGIRGRDNTPVDADYQYNIASVTKPVVATVILQLYEEGELDLQDKAAEYLGNVSFFDYSNIHMMEGTPMGDQITIDMLLTHTSGLADIFSDAATRFNRSLLEDPQQGFSPEKMASIYYGYELNTRPASAPGQGYHYSDINYNLLGLIIEQVTGKTLPQAIRERVLEPLNMEDTYFEYYEETDKAGKRTDAYYYDMNITQNVNTSYEWGGGGLVSTTEDMATYITALMNGELYDKESTLDKMLDTSLTDPYAGDYGRGIFRYRLFGEAGERTLFGHSGFFGSDLAYDLENKVVIATHINQSSPSFNTRELMGRVLDVMYTDE